MGGPATEPAVLELDGIRMRFGSVEALRGASFALRGGEVLGLVGDNGAGKSTVVKILSGVYQPTDGVLRYRGEPVRFKRPEDAARHGIATVYQDLALCDNLDTVANLFLGAELRGAAGWLSESAMERRATDLLATLDVRIPDVRREVSTLSGGQRQSIAIARSLVLDPQVILLDEPTAALGVEQTGEVLRLIEGLRDRGLAIVLISHNLRDVFAVADRIVVLRLGAVVVDRRVDDVTEEEIVAAITGAAARKSGEEAAA